MCECTCGNIKGDIVFVTGDAYVNVDAYFGCEECSRLVGIDVSVFTEQGAREFLGPDPMARINPDDYGGPQGQRAACFEMFNMDDLAEAATLLGFVVPPDYENWRDFMDEYGVKWLRAAATCCDIRKREEAALPSEEGKA